MRSAHSPTRSVWAEAPRGVTSIRTAPTKQTSAARVEVDIDWRGSIPGGGAKKERGCRVAPTAAWCCMQARLKLGTTSRYGPPEGGHHERLIGVAALARCGVERLARLTAGLRQRDVAGVDALAAVL